MKNQHLLSGLLLLPFLLLLNESKAQNCLNVTTTISPVLCPNDHDGSIKLIVSGGSGNYRYIWNEYPANMGSFQGGLAPGTYGYVVQDLQNLICYTTGSAMVNSINIICGVGITEVNKLDNVLNVFPNPSDGNTTVLCEIPGDYNVLDILGHSVAKIYLNSGLNKISLSLSGGIYFLQNQFVISHKIIIQ